MGGQDGIGVGDGLESGVVHIPFGGGMEVVGRIGVEGEVPSKGVSVTHDVALDNLTRSHLVYMREIDLRHIVGDLDLVGVVPVG